MKRVRRSDEINPEDAAWPGRARLARARGRLGRGAVSLGCWLGVWTWLVGAVGPGLFWLRAGGAECSLEGTVKLPAPTLARPITGRYRDLAPAAVGPPPAPRAVVYLEGVFPATATAAPPSVAAIEQRGFQFIPALLPVRVGTKVTFPNRDDEYHNVLSYSKAREFDLGRYLKSENPPAVLFERPGVVELNCEIHEHMRAYILVLATPYFTTTDTAGQFRLDHLPPGHYVLKAWVNPRRVWQRPVDLAAGQTARAEFPP